MFNIKSLFIANFKSTLFFIAKNNKIDKRFFKKFKEENFTTKALKFISKNKLKSNF